MFKNACVWLSFVAAVTVIAVSTEAAPPSVADHEEATTALQEFDCGYRSHEEWLAEFQAAVARGEVVDPALRPLPTVAPGRPRTPTAADCGLSREQIFAFEDTDWTKYSALVMWIYSKEKTGRFTIDAVTRGDDYFEAWNNITWTGWKEVRIPLRGKGSRFSRIAKAKWSRITRFRIWKNDGTPLDIVIDDIRLERITK